MSKYVWITRPQPQAEHMAAQLKRRGISSIVSPAILLQEGRDAVQHCARLDKDVPIIITSQMALHTLAHHTLQRSNALVLTGQALQAMAHDYGFYNVMSGQGNAASVVPLLLERHYYYLHGNHTAFDMITALEMRGISCTAIEIYRSNYATTLDDALISALKEQSISAITCYSIFTAQAIQHLLIKYDMLHYAQHLPVYCISEAIEKHMRNNGFSQVMCGLI